MSAPRLIYDIGRRFTAHDVRKLRPCATCNHAGYLPQMLTLEGKTYHSACIAAVMTREQILVLPPSESAKLRLNEIGGDLMMELLNRAAPSARTLSDAAPAIVDHVYEHVGFRDREKLIEEVSAILAAATPTEQREGEADWLLRDLLAIQDACGLHTDEYAPGSVIEYIKELEADIRAATSAPGEGEAKDTPTNEELEAVWEGHIGHPADFAADVLERWGGWPMGVLGYGGSLEAMLAKAAQPGDDVVRDAARWRAFIGSARICPLGSAGLVTPEPNNYAHMGLEIWTTYDRDYSTELLKRMDYENKVGREWLIKYADIATAAQAITATQPDSASDAGGQKTACGPDNPARLRKHGESVEDYRRAMGWDQPNPVAKGAGGQPGAQAEKESGDAN